MINSKALAVHNGVTSRFSHDMPTSLTLNHLCLETLLILHQLTSTPQVQGA
jgi:hypothetical protein